MKVLISVVLLSLIGNHVVAADALKIAFVDLQKALQTTEAGKQAKSSLEKEVGTKRETLEKKESELRKEAEAFEKKAAIMSDAAKSAKQQDLQKKFGELQKSVQESQVDLQKREREYTKPIIDELRVIIEGIGKEKGYTLILEKNEGGVLFAQNGDEITDSVIEKFNSAHKSKKKS